MQDDWTRQNEANRRDIAAAQQARIDAETAAKVAEDKLANIPIAVVPAQRVRAKPFQSTSKPKTSLFGLSTLFSQ